MLKRPMASWWAGRWQCGFVIFLLALQLCVVSRILKAQGRSVESGLDIPNSKTPWAVDVFEAKPQLVPLHHSIAAVNRHQVGNLTGALTTPFFYKPKLTTELEGNQSRNQLHTKTPIFYVLFDFDQDVEGSGKQSDLYTFSIVRAVQVKDRRVVDSLAYTFTGDAKRKANVVIDTAMTKAQDGWIRIEPKGPMDEGEYCLLPIPTIKGAYSPMVFDFGIHLGAPNAKDAVVAAR